MAKIRLAPDLAFDSADLATKVVAALGMRGSGKSNVMAVIAEGLMDQGIPVVVLDHVGIWFSLRLGPGGKSASHYNIPVLGGQHGDIALLPSAGATVGETLAKNHSAAVLDVSSMRKNDRMRFAADFAESFFHAKKSHPGAVFLLVEESQRFIPQKLFPGQERMLGAFEEIAEVGRNYGIGLGLLSQRPQKINKDVLNLAEIVFGFQANGVLERKAIAEWVQESGAQGRAEVQGELPGLPTGTALVWSPGAKIYGKYALYRKATYDAGATPIHARAAVKVRALDLKALETAMGAAVEEARANDPKVLRARIAELEKLAVKGGVEPAKKTVVSIQAADLKRLGVLIDTLLGREATFVDAVEKQRDRLAQAQQAVVSEVGNLRTIMKQGLAPTAVRQPAAPGSDRRSAVGAATIAQAQRNGLQLDTPLSKCARALLSVIVQRGAATDSQISALSGYRKTSSGFTNALSELRVAGLIDGPKDRRVPTEAGRAACGPLEPLPTGAALLSYWQSRLTKCERELLGEIYRRGTIDRASLAESTGYSQTSSGFTNAISGLRVLDLIHGPSGGDLTIADVFKE